MTILGIELATWKEAQFDGYPLVNLVCYYEPVQLIYLNHLLIY